MSDRCPPCEAVFANIDPKTVELMELHEFQVTRAAELTFEAIGKELFSVSKLAANDEPLEIVDPKTMPLGVQRYGQFAALLYAAGYIAARYSTSNESDEMLINVLTNAINDGNAVVCGMDGHDGH